MKHMASLLLVVGIVASTWCPPARREVPYVDRWRESLRPVETFRFNDEGDSWTADHDHFRDDYFPNDVEEDEE